MTQIFADDCASFLVDKKNRNNLYVEIQKKHKHL